MQFIGSVIKPNRIYVLNRTKGSLYYKLRNLFNNPDEKRLDKLIMTVNSYIGYMKHYNTYNIRKFFLNNSGLLDKLKAIALLTMILICFMNKRIILSELMPFMVV